MSTKIKDVEKELDKQQEELWKVPDPLDLFVKASFIPLKQRLIEHLMSQSRILLEESIFELVQDTVDPELHEQWLAEAQSAADERLDEFIHKVSAAIIRF